jgi:hypothetical protein
MSTYFAMDGNYGYAHGLVVIDTKAWTVEDWDAIENASDYDRITVALTIAMEEK